MTLPDGHRYDGEWSNGVPHGQGVRTWPDGQRYDGEWRNGVPHGQDVHTPPDMSCGAIRPGPGE